MVQNYSRFHTPTIAISSDFAGFSTFFFNENPLFQVFTSTDVSHPSAYGVSPLELRWRYGASPYPLRLFYGCSTVFVGGRSEGIRRGVGEGVVVNNKY